MMEAPRTSSTLDVFPTDLLVKCIDVLLPLLTALVNCANTFGMPLDYKHAVVTPILKKKNLDPKNLANYRPVSNTPFVAKLIEPE